MAGVGDLIHSGHIFRRRRSGRCFVREFGERQIRVVSEILECAAERAGQSLAIMVHGDLVSEVCTLTVLSPENVAEHVQDRVGIEAWVVAQSFFGPLNGDARLAIPSEPAMRIVRGLIGSETVSGEPSDLEIDALTEIGNIFLNAFVAEIADNLDADIQTSVPLCARERDFSRQSRMFPGNDNEGVAMIVSLDLGFGEAEADACVVLTLNGVTAGHLTRLVDRFAVEAEQ